MLHISNPSNSIEACGSRTFARRELDLELGREDSVAPKPFQEALFRSLILLALIIEFLMSRMVEQPRLIFSASLGH